MKVSAVVVNYRTSTDLNKFLQSWIDHHPTYKWSLTIASVDPLDEDLEVAEMWAGGPIEHVIHESNVGYAKACNHAAARSSADVYAFFNADVWFRDNAVDHLVWAMENNPHWGVVGPKQVDSQNRLTHAGIFGSRTEPKHRAWHAIDTGRYNDVCPAVTVSGAAYFVRADAWNQLKDCEVYQKSVSNLGIGPAVGAFLPTQHYYEETWCSYHAAAHGWPVMYYGEAAVMHEWHKASPVGSVEARFMPESQRLFRAACDEHRIDRN